MNNRIYLHFCYTAAAQPPRLIWVWLWRGKFMYNFHITLLSNKRKIIIEIKRYGGQGTFSRWPTKVKIFTSQFLSHVHKCISPNQRKFAMWSQHNDTTRSNLNGKKSMIANLTWRKSIGSLFRLYYRVNRIPMLKKELGFGNGGCVCVVFLPWWNRSCGNEWSHTSICECIGMWYQPQHTSLSLYAIQMCWAENVRLRLTLWIFNYLEETVVWQRCVMSL